MRRATFLAGLLAIAASLSPWADSLSDRSLTAHMLQHLVLTLVAAPLLVLGAPVDAVLRMLPPAGARRLVRALLRLTNPLFAWTLFVGIQWATHVTPFYELAVERSWVHACEHALYVASALIFWWPVFGRPARLRGPGRPLYVLLAMPAMGVLGLVLLTSDSRWYSSYSIAQQHAAGGLMWVVSSLLMVGLLVLSVWEWLQREERRAVAREAYGR